MARRRDDRVQIELPVRVWGMTIDGKPFNRELKTRDVSRFGARVAYPNCPLKLGDIVGVQYKTEKARFRIVWIANNKSEFGIATSEPGKSIWGSLPAGAAVHPGRAPSAAPAPVPAAPVVRQHERRRHHRFPCQGGVQIRRADSADSVATWATLADISAGGCYIESTLPLTMGVQLDLTLKIADAEIRCKGQVRTSHPGIGAGVQFTMVAVEARKQLNQVLDVLAGVTASEQVPAAPAEGKTDITGRVYKSAEELRAIETLLTSDTADVDPRILSEFRNAVDHARQTAWAVQTWIELRKQRRDPFTLMPLVEKRRIRQAIFLLKELLMDYQSTTITTETEGYSDLDTAVTEFYQVIHHQ